MTGPINNDEFGSTRIASGWFVRRKESVTCRRLDLQAMTSTMNLCRSVGDLQHGTLLENKRLFTAGMSPSSTHHQVRVAPRIIPNNLCVPGRTLVYA